VRVVDYETARRIDSVSLGRTEKVNSKASKSTNILASVTNMDEWLETSGRKGVTINLTESSERAAK